MKYSIGRTYMCNRKILVFVSLCLLVLSSAFAEDKKIVLGGKAGWPSLSVMDGVTLGKGKFGYDCMQLATNSRSSDSGTDLLIDFETSRERDITGNYSVKKDNM